MWFMKPKQKEEAKNRQNKLPPYLQNGTVNIPTINYLHLLNIETWAEVIKRNVQITHLQKAIARRDKKIKYLKKCLENLLISNTENKNGT